MKDNVSNMFLVFQTKKTKFILLKDNQIHNLLWIIL